MRVLNLQHRGVDRTTDVLSFPQQNAKTLKNRMTERDLRTSGRQTSEHMLVLGDLVINLPRAKKQASDYRVSLSEELKKLIVHGLLHLVGYDHEKNRYQKKKMELKEREILKGLRYL